MYITAKVPTSDSGTATLGMIVADSVAQKQEDHEHDQHDGQNQLELHVFHRSADRHGPIGQDRHVDGGRQSAAELLQELFDPVDDLDHVRARLALDVHDDGRGGVQAGTLGHPRGLPHVLDVVDHVGDVRQHDGPGGAVRDHDRLILRGREELVVGRDGVGLPTAVEVSFGLVDVGRDDRGPHVLEIQPAGQECGRIELHAHSRLLAAADADHADARLLCDLLGQPRIRQVFDLGQGERIGAQRQRQDGRVGRIGLVVDRRIRQVGRKVCRRRVDRRLDLLFGDVDVQRKLELQDDDRAPVRAGRRHLVEPRHLAELAFQGRRDGRRHHVRAGAGIERQDLDRGVVDLRQGGDRQLKVRDGADQYDRDHEQHGRDRPQNEQPRRTHWAACALLFLEL